jgi:iron complex outermembrane receptor protein
MATIQAFARTGIGGFVLAAAVLGSIADAAAQTATPSAAQAAARQSALEEITVTAQRREENLQTVPVAVTAFTAAEIERRQISDTFDLVQHVPNLAVFHNAGSIMTANAYYLRGIGNPESLAVTDVPVGTYIDDFYVPRQQSANMQLADVERVEVLRGPQGTLFGRNTTGGAVNIITRKPGDKVEGYVSLGYGRYNKVDAKASVSGPVLDKLSLGASAFLVRDDGYSTSISSGGDNYGQAKGWGVKGTARLRPSDAIDWIVAVSKYQSSGWTASSTGNPAFRGSNDVSATPSGRWEFNNQRLLTCDRGARPRDWLANGCAFNRVKETAITSTLQVEIGAVTLSALTGYRHMNHDYSLDFGSNSPYAALSSFVITNEGIHDVFSQEFKANGEAMDGRLKFVVGAFYMKEHNRTDFQDWFAFNRGAFLLSADRVLKNDTESFAVYTQEDFRLTDKLTAVAGVRWTQEHKTLDLRVFQPGTTRILFTAANINGSPNFHEVQVTPKFALQYQVTDEAMAYVSATKGFKSGGWNGRATNPVGFTDFRGEKVWSYEAGIRTDLFDRRVRFNATGFIAKYTDLQINSAFTDRTTNQSVFIAQNSGDSRSYGGEFELTAVLTDGLNVFSSIGLQKAKWLRLSPQAIAAGFTLATTIANTPSFTWDLGFTYAVPVQSLGGTLQLSATGKYTPSYLQQLTPASISRYTKRYLVDAGISYERDGAPWSLGLECTNCTNHKYWRSPSTPGGTPGDFFRWMVRAKYKL